MSNPGVGVVSDERVLCGVAGDLGHAGQLGGAFVPPRPRLLLLAGLPLTAGPPRPDSPPPRPSCQAPRPDCGGCFPVVIPKAKAGVSGVWVVEYEAGLDFGVVSGLPDMPPRRAGGTLNCQLRPVPGFSATGPGPGPRPETKFGATMIGSGNAPEASLVCGVPLGVSVVRGPGVEVRAGPARIGVGNALGTGVFAGVRRVDRPGVTGWNCPGGVAVALACCRRLLKPLIREPTTPGDSTCAFPAMPDPPAFVCP